MVCLHECLWTTCILVHREIRSSGTRVNMVWASMWVLGLLQEQVPLQPPCRPSYKLFLVVYLTVLKVAYVVVHTMCECVGACASGGQGTRLVSPSLRMLWDQTLTPFRLGWLALPILLPQPHSLNYRYKQHACYVTGFKNLHIYKKLIMDRNAF